MSDEDHLLLNNNQELLLNNGQLLLLNGELVTVWDYYQGFAPPPDNDLVGFAAQRMLAMLLEGERGQVPKHIRLHLVSPIPGVQAVGALHISLTLKLHRDPTVEDFYLGEAPEPVTPLLGSAAPRMLAYVGDSA